MSNATQTVTQRKIRQPLFVVVSDNEDDSNFCCLSCCSFLLQPLFRMRASSIYPSTLSVSGCVDQDYNLQTTLFFLWPPLLLPLVFVLLFHFLAPSSSLRFSRWLRLFLSFINECSNLTALPFSMVLFWNIARAFLQDARI